MLYDKTWYGAQSCCYSSYIRTLVPRLDGQARVDNSAWALVAMRDNGN